MKKSYLLIPAVVFTLGLTTTFSNTTMAKSSKAKVVSTQHMSNTKYNVSGGKIYKYSTLIGTKKNASNYLKWTFSSNKSAKIKKNGKTKTYYYIKSSNGKVQGYIYSKFLSKVKNKNRKNSEINVSETTGYYNDGTKIKIVPASAFNSKEYKDEFINKLNEIRSKYGINSVKENSEISDIAQHRSVQVVTNFDHYDDNGNSIATDLFKKEGLNYKAECINSLRFGGDINMDSKGLFNAKDAADESVNEYVYDDADSNWGHKAILLDPTLVNIGVGVTSIPTDDVDGSPTAIIYDVINFGE